MSSSIASEKVTTKIILFEFFSSLTGICNFKSYTSYIDLRHQQVVSIRNGISSFLTLIADLCENYSDLRKNCCNLESEVIIKRSHTLFP